MNYPGACTISTEQVCFLQRFFFTCMIKNNVKGSNSFITSKIVCFQGQELRKEIGALAYIECSSKTQQVTNHQCLSYIRHFKTKYFVAQSAKERLVVMMMILQNVKVVFDAAIKVVLQPPSKTKKQKRKIGLCHLL